MRVLFVVCFEKVSLLAGLELAMRIRLPLASAFLVLRLKARATNQATSEDFKEKKN